MKKGIDIEAGNVVHLNGKTWHVISTSPDIGAPRMVLKVKADPESPVSTRVKVWKYREYQVD